MSAELFFLLVKKDISKKKFLKQSLTNEYI